MYKPFSYREARGLLNHAVEIVVTSRWGHNGMRGETVGQVASSVVRLGVVQALVEWLQKRNGSPLLDTDRVPESHPDSLVDAGHVANDKWRSEQNDEENEHEEVEDGETNHPSLAKLRLLERVDRRTDLTTANK